MLVTLILSDLKRIKKWLNPRSRASPAGARVTRIRFGYRQEGVSVMGAQSTDALEVLRDVWRSQAQSAADLGDDCETKACKKMADAGVGFDDYAAGDESARRAAWRARLEREGKLGSAGSLRDLILPPATTDAG